MTACCTRVFDDGRLRIDQLVSNALRTNGWLLARDGHALLIDPSDDAAFLLSRLQGLELDAMLATHAHFDHVAAAGGVAEATGVAPLWLHADDLPTYRRANSYSMMLQRQPIQPAPVRAFDAGLHALLADWGLVLRHAGGHTPGSCWLHDAGGRFLITGDLALHHAIKPTLVDPREDRAQWAAFVATVVAGFEPATLLLPGHGAASSVGDEDRLNRKWQHVRRPQPVAA